jgi:hypothetical protein
MIARVKIIPSSRIAVARQITAITISVQPSFGGQMSLADSHKLTSIPRPNRRICHVAIFRPP